MEGWMSFISILGGPPVLLLNHYDGGNHWLSIPLRGTRSNRDGYGARVSVNGQTRFATTAGGYGCANDKRLHFGLGSAEKATAEVHLELGQVYANFAQWPKAEAEFRAETNLQPKPRPFIA